MRGASTGWPHAVLCKTYDRVHCLAESIQSAMQCTSLTLRSSGPTRKILHAKISGMFGSNAVLAPGILLTLEGGHAIIADLFLLGFRSSYVQLVQGEEVG